LRENHQSGSSPYEDGFELPEGLLIAADHDVQLLVFAFSRIAIRGRYLCENRFNARVTLELVEGSPEFYLFLEQHRELDTQLGGPARTP